MSELQVKTMAEFMAEGKEVDILFWVGSAGSFDDRAKKITKAFIQIMNKAKINFGVLGIEESSSGDAAKRAGNEFLFQMQAMTNIEVMNTYKVKRIVTTCPHSYNTIKNEYPSLGGNYTVQHHTEFISDLIAEGKLTITGDLKGKEIVYHDPCYLGRANGVYDSPRSLIKSLDVDILEILNKSTQNISFFLTKTRYDIIQHRNFFMPNRRNTKHIKVFNGKICIYLKTEYFKKKLIKYTMKLLKEWFNKYNDKIEENKKTQLMSCFNKYKNKNKTYIQNLYENVDTFLLTYSVSIKSIISKRIKEEKSNDNNITILNKLLENI